MSPLSHFQCPLGQIRAMALGISLLLLAQYINLIPPVVQDVQAQESQQITISTSSDSHDNRFFGEGVLQVVINDPDADDDAAIETIDVRIIADPERGNSGTTFINVPETSKSSGRFEFFLVHQDASAVSPHDIDSINSRGVQGDGVCSEDCAPFVTFGFEGNVTVASDLYEPTEFEIQAGDTEISVDYDHTIGTLELDRNQYGSTSFIHAFIKDQDANLNPSKADEFTVDPENEPNSDLLSLNGGSIDHAVTFRETGDDTAIFEGIYQLRVSMHADSKSLILTLYEKANYGGTLFESENDSNSADEVGFVIGDSDGVINGNMAPSAAAVDPIIITDKNTYNIDDLVRLSINDTDANTDPNSIDTVEVKVSSMEDHIEASLHETGKNTGIFEQNFSLNLGQNQSSMPSNEIATLKVSNTGDNITLQYLDKKPSDYAQKIINGENPEKLFSLTIKVSAQARTGIDTIRVVAPVAKDVQGKTLSSVSAGQQVILSTTVVNNNDQSQPFAAIVEVRDSSGITVYLAWQTGTLNPNGRAEVGLSWTPGEAGNYEMRTFTVSEFMDPEILSPVAKSTIAIN